MKLVLFGAGKIGRSFIGQLFSRSGFEVVFIDKDRRLVDALNSARAYKVFICDTHPETIVVEHVRGVYAEDMQAVTWEIASADMLAVSIGKTGLPYIVPALSEGLLLREKRTPGRALDIILAENMRNADSFLYEKLSATLPADYLLYDRVGLVETSIGKMVPLIANQSNEDVLSVAAEAYNTLIVDKQAFINPIPCVTGLSAKDNMKAWVDRKLFIHNFGHAAAAYMGYLQHPGSVYIWEVLEDVAVLDFAKVAMKQSAAALQYAYPGVFTDAQLQEHINDLLRRFANRSLGDTVFRVGCDLYRKLSPDDRIVIPLLSAKNAGLPCDKIVQVLMAALQFKATDPDGNMFPADTVFHRELAEKGRESILQQVCGLTGALLLK